MNRALKKYMQGIWKQCLNNESLETRDGWYQIYEVLLMKEVFITFLSYFQIKYEWDPQLYVRSFEEK